MTENQDIYLCANTISNWLLENNLLLNKNMTALLHISLSKVKFPGVTSGDIIIKPYLKLKVQDLQSIISFHLNHKSQIYIKLKPYVNVLTVRNVSYWSTHLLCSLVLTTQIRSTVNYQTIDSKYNYRLLLGRSFRITALLNWNLLPNKLRCISNVISFRAKVKHYSL